MNTAIDLGKRSRCFRGAIGCVIVSSDNRVLAASYVGPSRDFLPANEDPSTDCRSWCPRSQPGAETDPSYSNCISCHAEQNAIARCQGDPTGGTVYVNGSVCINCAKLLAAAGVARVVMKVLESDSHRNPGAVINFLVLCGVDVTRTS
jgi:dCMP deaminase